MRPREASLGPRVLRVLCLLPRVSEPQQAARALSGQADSPSVLGIRTYFTMWRLLAVLSCAVLGVQATLSFQPLSDELVNYVNKQNTTWQVCAGDWLRDANWGTSWQLQPGPGTLQQWHCPDMGTRVQARHCSLRAHPGTWDLGMSQPKSEVQ